MTMITQLERLESAAVLATGLLLAAGFAAPSAFFVVAPALAAAASGRSLLWARTPLDLPILLFLAATTLSALFSPFPGVRAPPDPPSAPRSAPVDPGDRAVWVDRRGAGAGGAGRVDSGPHTEPRSHRHMEGRAADLPRSSPCGNGIGHLHHGLSPLPAARGPWG